jgi:hypothetical protein
MSNIQQDNCKRAGHRLTVARKMFIRMVAMPSPLATSGASSRGTAVAKITVIAVAQGMSVPGSCSQPSARMPK